MLVLCLREKSEKTRLTTSVCTSGEVTCMPTPKLTLSKQVLSSRVKDAPGDEAGFPTKGREHSTVSMI